MSKLFPHHRGQMSEAFRTVMFLSASGGLQDAYTYIGRGKVFANAQTGNIVLMSQSLFDGDLSRFAHYFIPVLSFALGVAAAECIRLRWRQARRIHWRQLVVLAEIVLLFAVGFFCGVGYWRKRAGLVCLRHAGAGVPQGAWLPVCQYHVHRQPAQRHGRAGRIRTQPR